MTAQELMKPRFEVIGDYPGNDISVGEVFESNSDWPESYLLKYPHLFRKLNWWEHRKEEDMPKKVKTPDYDNVYEIVKWDMNMMFGFTDEKAREGCDLNLFKPEYGYFPVD